MKSAVNRASGCRVQPNAATRCWVRVARCGASLSESQRGGDGERERAQQLSAKHAVDRGAQRPLSPRQGGQRPEQPVGGKHANDKPQQPQSAKHASNRPQPPLSESGEAWETSRAAGGRGAAAAGRSSSRQAPPGRAPWHGRQAGPPGRAARRPSSPRALTDQIGACRELGALTRLVEQHAACLNHVHASAALSRAAKLPAPRAGAGGRSASACVKALVAAAKPCLATCKARQLANMAWAVAKLGHEDAGFLAQLLALALPLLADFNTQHLANTAWAMATLNHVDNGFMQQLLRHAGPQLQDFNPQELANLAWAMAKLNYIDTQPLEQLLACARPKLPDFTPQALANTAWAMATLNHVDKGFMEQLLACARPKLPDFTPQALANTVWAMAKLDHVDKQFLGMLLEQARAKLPSFPPQELSSTAWAIATIGHQDRSFVEQLLLHARPQLRDFNPQALSTTAWAMATLTHANPPFLRQLLAHADAQLPGFSTQNLANTAWAMAMLRHEDPAFLDRLLSHLLADADRIQCQCLCNTAWALSILEHDAEATMGPVLAAASALMSADASPLVRNFRQIQQYIMTMEAAGRLGAGPEPGAEAHGRLREACRRAWVEGAVQPRPSYTQREVLAALLLLPGCGGARSEHPTEDGLMSMDIALHLPCGTRVAVEVDGPTHFMSNAPRQLNGSTVWRNRMLEARGWRVLSVNVVEWQQLKSQDRRRMYFFRKLREAGIEL